VCTQTGTGGADAQADIGRFLDALAHEGLLPLSPTQQQQPHAHALPSPLRQVMMSLRSLAGTHSVPKLQHEQSSVLGHNAPSTVLHLS
jgi:hypothetical protein